MGTEMEGRLDPLAHPGLRARWSWRRAERRAVAAHEHDVAEELHRLSTWKVAVFPVAERPAGGGTGDRVKAVRLRLHGWQLLLVGVAAAPRAELEHVAGYGRLRLDAAGRYGKFWWLGLVSDGPADVEKLVLLGSHLRLTPAGGGRGRAWVPRPAGHLVA